MTPDELAERFERAATRVGPALRGTVRHEATLLKALIMANASGRPGPNVITGRYRASWRVVMHAAGAEAAATAGTEEPYGRRLEFGFAGTDSLGRVYNQPPYPHAGPAVHHLSSRYRQAFQRAVEEILA